VAVRSAIVVLALTGCLALTGVAVAKPPSFALWSIRWDAQVSRAYERLSDKCTKTSGGSDVELGACVVAGDVAALRAEQAKWEQGVAELLRGQTPRCKIAIRAYRTSWRTEAAGLLAYFAAHRNTRMAQVFRDVRKDPLAALHRRTENATSYAFRVCG
jgi:hypothetical protein